MSISSPGIRISFRLHDPASHSLENIFNPSVKCPLDRLTPWGKNQNTGEVRTTVLPESLTRVNNVQDVYGRSRSGRVLDFTVSISTNLKLLFIGDSVMVQLAQAFDEMVGGVEMQSRKVLWDTAKGHEGAAVTAPTRGGGVSAMWRMTGLISLSNRGKPPANERGGGWSDDDICAFTNYSYEIMDEYHRTSTINKFDVVVLRVMHGWMELHEITHDRLVEAIRLSYTRLGATTVVLMTVPFGNNVKTIEDMIKVNEINEDIRSIAREWRSRRVEGLQHVLVLEFGTYYNHILWSNGRHLGYNVSHPLRATQYDFDLEGPDMLLDRLHVAGSPTIGNWPPSIPMVCSDTSLLVPDRRTCHRNYLFSDGIHLCPETLASRFAAGLACLVGCVYNGHDSSKFSSEINEEHLFPEIEHDIRKCEKECNEQFLSVVPIEESWLETTMASFGV